MEGKKKKIKEKVDVFIILCYIIIYGSFFGVLLSKVYEAIEKWVS